MTLAPTSFTALKMALAVPGTPAIPVLHYLIINKLRRKKPLKFTIELKNEYCSLTDFQVQNVERE